LQILICVLILHTYEAQRFENVLKEQVLQSSRHLLRPLVRFLLKNGVTYAEFADACKDVYVDVARQDYGLQGRPTNNSRVAMLTGLSRREVARVRDRLLEGIPEQEQLQSSRISQILSGWHLDPEFMGQNGRPKDLPPTGPSGSLSALLKRYAGDLPHGAIRKEMLQRGLIEELENGDVRVLKRDYVYSSVDPEIVRQMGVALHDHAATLEHNLDESRKSDARFEGIADNGAVSIKAVRAFHQLVAERGMEFLQSVDAWLSKNEVDATQNPGRKVRLGVGVYMIHEEI
jgi:hypothetical protein